MAVDLTTIRRVFTGAAVGVVALHIAGGRTPGADEPQPRYDRDAIAGRFLVATGLGMLVGAHADAAKRARNAHHAGFIAGADQAHAFAWPHPGPCEGCQDHDDAGQVDASGPVEPSDGAQVPGDQEDPIVSENENAGG